MSKDIEFNSKSSKDKIISILKQDETSSDIKIEDDEINDFAKFGVSFGIGAFVEPLRILHKSQEMTPIVASNVFDRIERKEILNKIDINKLSFDQEIEFISSNFNTLCNDDFIKWCKIEKNHDYVEQIIINEKLHIKNEDQLFSFVMAMNKEGNNFINLFSRINLEFCSVESCQEIYEFAKKKNIFKGPVFECIAKKLLYDKNQKFDSTKYSSRYTKDTINEIKEQSTFYLKDENKYQQMQIESLKGGVPFSLYD